MNKKLKPCPFCGNEPEIELFKDYGYIIHGCCIMINHDKLYKTEQEAIKAWNRRQK